jgi:O-succinylbenzoic acid--CoA ligase
MEAHMESIESLPNWLKKRAELTPDRLAIIVPNGEQLTFGELDQKARKLASKLSFIDKGDHVALLLSNTVESVLLLYGLQYIGATAVLLNTRLTPHELEWQITDANSQFFIFDEPNLQKAKAIGNSSLNVEKFALEDVCLRKSGQVALKEEVNLDEVHSLIYTSGTTGKPKGVMLTYGNHWWSATGSALNLGSHLEDRWLCCLPIFHVSGLSILMRSVLYGIPVVLFSAFEPTKINKAIRDYEVTIISVVSVMLDQMLDEKVESFHSIRCVLLGGGPAPMPLLEKCKALSIPVFQTYGMTETASQIVTLSPEYMLSKLGSAGKPLFPAQLRIMEGPVEKAYSEIGEIVVKGPNVTKGYYNRSEATNSSIKGGWLYTGDLGFIDEDGFLYVVDRRSDMFVSGGENIYPAEIESVLLEHEGVQEVGVTGLEDLQWGKVPIAFIKVSDDFDLSEDDIIKFCKTRLAKYKVPKQVYVVNELPRNAAKKLLRRELLQLITDRLR